MPFGLSVPYLWLGLAIVFGIVEIVTTSLVSVWFVAGALASMAVAFFAPDAIAVQVLAFIAVTAVTLYFTRPVLVKKMLKKTPTNADMLIGKTAVVTQEISVRQKGRVKVDGLTWQASSSQNLATGENCRITKIEGVTLIVEKP